MNRASLLSMFILCVLAAVFSPSVRGQEPALSDHELSVWRSLVESPLHLNISVKNTIAQDVVFFDQPVEIHGAVANIAALEAYSLSSEMLAVIKAHGVDVQAVLPVSFRSGNGLWTTNLLLHVGLSTNSPVATIPLSLTQFLSGPQNEVGVNGLSARGFFVIPSGSDIDAGTYVAWASVPATVGTATAVVTLCSAPIGLTVKLPATGAESAWVLAEQAREQEMNGRLKEAEVLYRKALQKSPALERGPLLGGGHRMFNLHSELADLYERMGKFDDALAETREYEEHVSSLPESFRSELMDNVVKMRNRLELSKDPRQKKSPTPRPVTPPAE